MNHEIYIDRCLHLARLGLGNVAPNPMVGCVIVKDGKVIGEGYHQIYGGPHAEVNAINSVKNQSDLSGSTVYVNLEPCAHHGLTPPCSDLLIQHKVGQVIVCNCDPYYEVNGAGIAKLESAGIEVSSGINEAQGLHLNRRFFTFHTKKRPYVILKWAETSDGFIAPDQKDKNEVFWISGPQSQQLVHQWRSEESAILVGKHTVLKDNPKLDVRHTSGKNPYRVILDSNLEIPLDAHCFRDNAPCLVLNGSKSEKNGHIEFVKSDMTAPDILKQLHKFNQLSVIIEGGLKVLTSFIDSNLWDEIRQFKSETKLGTGVEAPHFKNVVAKQTKIGKDILNIYFND